MKTIYIDDENIGKWKARKIAKKIYKKMKKEDIIVALSNNLKDNLILKDNLSKYNIKVLNGRWLFKFLILDILEYVSKIKENRLDTLTLAILMDRADAIIIGQLIQIAKNVKILKIITSSKLGYLYIENELFTKHGIGIQITNNKEKSLSNVDIVLNYDFNKERLKKFRINPNAIIINLRNQIMINKDIFQGIVINDYEIAFNEEKFDAQIKKENFNKNILYESYIHRRDTFENIKKQMDKDNVKLLKLK